MIVCLLYDVSEMNAIKLIGWQLQRAVVLRRVALHLNQQPVKQKRAGRKRQAAGLMGALLAAVSRWALISGVFRFSDFDQPDIDLCL